MAATGLEDMRRNFPPLHKPWLKYGRPWCMHRGGWEMHYRTDYSLSIDRCLLQNVAVQDIWHNVDQ